MLAVRVFGAACAWVGELAIRGAVWSLDQYPLDAAATEDGEGS